MPFTSPTALDPKAHGKDPHPVWWGPWEGRRAEGGDIVKDGGLSAHLGYDFHLPIFYSWEP